MDPTKSSSSLPSASVIPSLSPPDNSQTDTPTGAQDVILPFFEPIIHEIDMHVIKLRSSQSELHKSIERLQAELEILLDQLHFPKIEKAVDKLAFLNRKVQHTNIRMAQVSSRLDSILRQAKPESPKPSKKYWFS